MKANNDYKRRRSNFYRVNSQPTDTPPGLKHDERDCQDREAPSAFAGRPPPLLGDKVEPA